MIDDFTPSMAGLPNAPSRECGEDEIDKRTHDAGAAGMDHSSRSHAGHSADEEAVSDRQSWPHYQQLVLDRLDEHRGALHQLRHEVYETRIEVAQLQVKSGVWGMIGGVIPILIALAFMLLSTGCWATRHAGGIGSGASGGSGIGAWLSGPAGAAAGNLSHAAGGGAVAVHADPFWPIGLIAVLCLVAGVLLLLTRNLIEGAIALGTAVGLMMLRAVLQEAAPMIFMFGLAAGIFFLGQYWGDLKIRRQTRRRVEQIDPEERATRPELRALEAIVRPWSRPTPLLTHATTGQMGTTTPIPSSSSANSTRIPGAGTFVTTHTTKAASEVASSPTTQRARPTDPPSVSVSVPVPATSTAIEQPN